MRLGVIFLAGVVGGMVGCYDFQSPLDANPEIAVDPELVGEWRCLAADPKPDEEAASIEFAVSGAKTYDIRVSGGGEGPERYHAYASRVAGSTVLNVRDPSDSSAEPWYLIRYSLLLPRVLRLELADDEPFAGEDYSSAALRAAVERAANEKSVYSDLCICTRIEREPAR